VISTEECLRSVHRFSRWTWAKPLTNSATATQTAIEGFITDRQKLTFRAFGSSVRGGRWFTINSGVLDFWAAFLIVAAFREMLA
jgi:hypothetical protein